MWDGADFGRFCGIFSSLLIPETARKTLEELTGTIALKVANVAGEEFGKSPESITPGVEERSPSPVGY